MKPLRSTARTRISVRSLGVAAAAALLLSSCSSTAPGVAAEVDGTRITDDQVDQFAEVLCAIGGVPGGDAGAPSKTARFTSLQILLTNQLTEEATDVSTVPQQTVSQMLEGMSAAREGLSADQQATFDQVAEEFARSQQATVQLGRQSLLEAGTPASKITDQAAYTAGQKAIAKVAEQLDVEVDPRFGTIENGQLQPSEGSLSVPVSDLAVKGADPNASADLVSQLPASQKCSSPS